MPRHSLLEYLSTFKQHGDEIAYVNWRGYRRLRWTYRQITETAYQFARELQSGRIGKGDRVLIWAENSAEWVVAFLGCALQGAIVVPMDNVATPDFALRVYHQVEAKLLVCSPEHLADAGSLPRLILADLPHQLAEKSRAEYPSPGLERGDALEIVFTSGTTAEPKGVVITHGNVLSNLEPFEREIGNYLKYERLVHPIRFLNLLPLSHVFGQFLGIFLPQLISATVIFRGELNPSVVMGTIKRERVSVLVAVPRILESLKGQIEREWEEAGQLESFRQSFRQAEGKHFLGRWWLFRRVHRRLGWKFWAFISGGAALDLATEEFWGRLGFAVIQGYGLTETTSLISVNHPFKLSHGSLGKVLAGREIKLDENGEILVRGGGVASAYWSLGELKPVADNEGWYRTGDVGQLDGQGNLYFKGRKKNVIVTPAGMNVYPEDLEASLRRQREVRDCVVIGLEHGGNAEPCAVLILRDPSIDPQAVVGRANESLAEYQRIRCWFVWREEDFPRTSTQKPRTSEIQRVVESRLSQRGPLPNETSPLAQMVARITGRRPTNRGPDADLETDFNLTSLERVELMSALEQRYQVDLSGTSFGAANTLRDLERMLQQGTVPQVQYHYPRWALGWPVTWLRWLAHYLALRPAIFLLGWPKIEGRENLGGVGGPVLVVCNHIADVDVGFVLTALPARLRNHLAAAAGGEAMEELRTPPPARGFFGRIGDRLQWALGAALLNIFPLPRQAGFQQSFAYAGEAVDRGYSVLVFPEGRHTATGDLLPFRAGIGILANSLEIPVVPMRIRGLFGIKQAGKKFTRPHQITVKIGAPVKFPPGSDPEWIAEELRNRVEDL